MGLAWLVLLFGHSSHHQDTSAKKASENDTGVILYTEPVGDQVHPGIVRLPVSK
jgi:hypothetical protein